jgi:hypothetical protein
LEGLTAEQVQAVLAPTDHLVLGCHAIQYGGSASPVGGELVVGWQVNPNGTVENAMVVESTFHNPDFEGCVAAGARRVQFPEATGPTEVQKRYRLRGPAAAM